MEVRPDLHGVEIAMIEGMTPSRHILSSMKHRQRRPKEFKNRQIRPQLSVANAKTEGWPLTRVVGFPACTPNPASVTFKMTDRFNLNGLAVILNGREVILEAR